MEDSKIIERYFQRDETAISDTKECYGERLRAVAFRILQNKQDAEECENDTYLKAWESIPPHRPRYFFAYLAKICRNTALHILEKLNAEKRQAVMVELTAELSECLPDQKSTETVSTRELGEIISTFLETISQENRIIFVRRYFLTESVSEIALALGVSQSKVKSSLFRTRNKLREALTKEELL